MQASFSEITSIGLDDDSWSPSRSDAESLLRLLSVSRADERTYSNVSIIPAVDGRSLYVKAH